MSIFYNMLRQKAGDPETRNLVSIIGRVKSNFENIELNYASISYKELLNLVDYYASEFKDPNFTEQPIEHRRKYIVVDNSISSLAVIIALLKCDSIPVIIDGKNIPIIPKKYLPYIDYGDMAKGGETFDMAINAYLRQMNVYKPLEGEDKPGTKLIICSSGSESLTPHLKVITEKELIHLPFQYGHTNAGFYSYVSCAHISGILTNLVNFLVHDNLILLTQNFDIEDVYFAKDMEKFCKMDFERKYIEKRYFLSTANPELINLVFGPESYYKGIYYGETHIEGDELVVKVQRPGYQHIFPNIAIEQLLSKRDIKPNAVMLPRDIVTKLSKADLSNVDLSIMKHIYMAGGVNSEDVVRAMREKIPSIPEGVFTNLYGSTEANGVICCCNEKDFKTCYINICDCESGKVRYTYDHKAFYEIEDGAVTEIASPEDTFGYMPYLSVSSERVPDVTIANAIDIMYQGKENGDLGIYIDNQLYVLGRKSELVKLKGKSYITNSLESWLSNELQAEVFVTPIGDAGIQPYIKASNINEFEDITKKYWACAKLGADFKKFHINPPVVIDDYIFERSKISGKLPHAVLKFLSGYVENQYNAIRAGKDGIIGMAKAALPPLQLYNATPQEDGGFIIDLHNRATMLMHDVVSRFYKLQLIGRDKVRYIPKPEIIFITDAHVDAGNRRIIEDSVKKILNQAIEESISAHERGELSEDKYRDPREAKNPDEIFAILKHNIMFDLVRRSFNKFSSKLISGTMTPEELENYSRILHIQTIGKKDPDDRDQR